MFLVSRVIRNDNNQIAMSSTALDLSSDSSSEQRIAATFENLCSPHSASISMVGIESSTPVYGANKPVRLTDGLHVDASAARGSRSFQWPGVDAVMESCQLHLEGNG